MFGLFRAQRGKWGWKAKVDTDEQFAVFECKFGARGKPKRGRTQGGSDEKGAKNKFET